MNKPLRLAMWSGPRNISTAMMRSWGNRADTMVIDEPFYAYYLRATALPHPTAEEIIAKGETDWRKVADSMISDPSAGKAIVYQKQMTHHLLPDVGRKWLGGVTNCFLIRDPVEVIVSYAKKNGDPALADLGFIQQAEIFEWTRTQTGKIPPVVDARDVLQNPEKTLRLLCAAVGVAFESAMLSWPPGLHATDGIWARYWYGEVVQSTGFQPYENKAAEVPPHLAEIHQCCRECYERLYHHRLR